MDRLVVCFQWHPSDADTEDYLAAACRVSSRLSELGGSAIGWGADRHSHEFAPSAFPMVLGAVLALIRAGVAHGVGFSQRPLHKGDGERRWGLGLIVAEALATTSRRGEILLDPAIEAVARGELATVGSLRVSTGGHMLAAALMVAESTTRGGYVSTAPNPSSTAATASAVLPNSAVPSAAAPSDGFGREVSNTDPDPWPAELAPESRGSWDDESGVPTPRMFRDRRGVVSPDAHVEVGSWMRTPTPPPMQVELPSERRSRYEAATERRSVPPPKPFSSRSGTMSAVSRLSQPPPKPSRPVSATPRGVAPPANLPAETVRLTTPVRVTAPDELAAVAMSGPEASVESAVIHDDKPTNDASSPPPPRFSQIKELRSRDAEAMLALVDELWNEDRPSGINERLQDLTRPSGEDMTEGLRQLQHAVEHGAEEGAAEQSRLILAYAVCLARAGKPAEALLESLQALARARRAGDAKGEQACALLLAELARYTGQPQLAERWLRIPGISA